MLIHLRSEQVSLVLAAGTGPARDSAGDPVGTDPAGSLLPVVRHWGAALPPDLDEVSLEAQLDGVLAPPVQHSGPDTPSVRRLLPMPGDGWRLRPGLRGSRPDGSGWSPQFVVRAIEVDGDSGATVTAADAGAGLHLVIRLRLHPGGLLQIDQELRNTDETHYAVVELGATLPVPSQATELFDLTGRWIRERSPQRHPFPMGSWVREGRHGRTGHDAPLLLAAGTAGFGFRSGEVWGLHLAWSGDGVHWAERNPVGAAHLGAAELLAPGEVRLAPGESYPAPPVYFGYSDRGLDGIGAQFHHLLRARPGHPRTPRPVLLNTWEAVYFDHRLDTLTTLADVAARVGVERFVLDDGWFGARRSDTAGLGDWYVSDDVWPAGLDPLISHVSGLGMQFGLWVEPEMVNPDSDLYRAHPDWILNVPGRLPPTWRGQSVLDLGRPGAFGYLLERLDALLADHDISYLKWDHNRDLVDAGHDGAAGVHTQTLALYRLLDELRARHPGVEIESCAAGGGRIDLGILARTDRVWASDTNDALERQQIQRWTAQLLPPELIGCHIGSSPSHTTGRWHSLAFRAATALFGHLGLELDLTQSDEAELAEVAGVIATYRRLRALLHGGDLVRIDHPDPAALVHGVVAPDRSAAVFSYVQLGTGITEVPPPFRLDGLDPARTYLVEPVPVAGGPGSQQTSPPPWVAAGGLTASGAVLMRVGLQPPILHPESALLLELRAL